MDRPTDAELDDSGMAWITKSLFGERLVFPAAVYAAGSACLPTLFTKAAIDTGSYGYNRADAPVCLLNRVLANLD